MSNVERVLWRIAELGARCSQHTAAGGRGPLWAELEQAIAGLDADFEAARQAEDIAPAQVRNLEGRLNVAQKERNRERARAEESVEDAQAARRERDRERRRAAKAMAALEEAISGHDQTVRALEQAVTARDRAVRSHDAAMARIAGLEADLERARADREVALTAHAEASADLSDAVDTLAARAEGAVVVLPGVALPEPPAGPVAPATRVSWQPTWSEWAGDNAVAPEDVAPEVVIPDADVTDADLTDDRADEIEFGDVKEGTTRRYLNVAATIGQLLPEDLGPLLLSGATVVRREGRLFATVAITTNPWEASGSDGAELAEKLADAGFRVEWTSAAPLAC